MLLPEDLESIDTSKLVRIYEDLNIRLTEDLIDRIIKGQEFTSANKYELQILIETGGKEIFEKALEECNAISMESKKEVKKMFNSMIDKDLEGYKDLFEYKGKKYGLSIAQQRILNSAIKNTNKTLRNFTNTVAFRMQNEYVNIVDRAYWDVESGGVDYNTAIRKAVKELSQKGVTLKDKAGRNVKLETAVKRNVLTGIKQTTNIINEDIDEELGCDGYEVTAHIGARPSHAEAQGKQYAKTKSDARKYGLGFWGDVEDLWQEPNCRHTFFGIIIGVSKPLYSKKELNKMENLKVNYNGKQISYYEATQKMNEIKRNKKELNTQNKILKESNQDNLGVYTKLKKQRNEFKILDNAMKKAESTV